MSDVTQHTTIPKNVNTQDDLSFDYLKKLGIDYIESLGSAFWTDYNTHDPGITILEVLSYAITDLGMRISMPIEDLLYDNAGNPLSNQFFSASQILPVKPVSASDYRKLIIDSNPLKIKNCWLKKHNKTAYLNCKDGLISYDETDFEDIDDKYIKSFEIKGLYSVLVDLEADDATDAEVVKEQIRKVFHANRNLCEDLAEISEVEKQPIAVCCQVDIDPEADEELIHAKITLALEDYLAPGVTFYSLTEMTRKGYTSDAIFEGPLLQNGFIDTTELEDSSLRTEVRLSDIIQIIMKIEGVSVIKGITINNCGADESETDLWNICIDSGKKPFLCHKSSINFTKGVLPVNVNKSKAAYYLKELKKERILQQQKAALDRELEWPEGTLTDSGYYTSVSNHFPEIYGIGEVGLSESATTERKAKAKQMKGYLLFFDQILVSYFKHLNNVKEQLSINNTLEKSYFTKAITDMEGVSELVNDYSSDDDALSESLFGHLDNAIKRNNLLKDHLIARFAERFSEYAFLMKTLFGEAADEIVLQNKTDFLSAYAIQSSQRGMGFNYYQQPVTNLWNTFNVTGLENRIAGLLGIRGETNPATGTKGIKRKNLSKLFVQIYDPTPGTPATNFRWRIRNSSNQIVLSATDDYLNESAAAEEMYASIILLFQTKEYEIAAAFETLYTNQTNGVSFTDTVINTVEVIVSDSGKYSFHIINPNITDINDPARIVARQYKLYLTLEEVEQAILSLMKFFKEEFSDEGIFLVEHLLLLPNDDESTTTDHFFKVCPEECLDSDCVIDPYSFRISVVLPGYTYRFSDVDFRKYAEDVIRQEIPSHILGRICWIGHRFDHLPKTNNDLTAFEKEFKRFLTEKTNGNQDHLPDFIDVLKNLNTIYPVGQLYNCEDETENLSGKIVLGRTNLGTL